MDSITQVKGNDFSKIQGRFDTRLSLSSANVDEVIKKRIDGLRCAEINANTAGGEYDLVFYSELRDADALQAFQNHPLHIAHRERCKALVTDRLCGDMEAD